MTKTCTTCKQVKDVTEYAKNRRTKDGLQSMCKDCNRASARQQHLDGQAILEEYRPLFPNLTDKDLAIQIALLRWTDKERNRFWSYGELEGDCLVWQGYKTDRGYGLYTVLIDGKYLATPKAHRLAYALDGNELPPSAAKSYPSAMTLDHLCGNEGCILPSHLEPVTHEENIRRRKAAA